MRGLLQGFFNDNAQIVHILGKVHLLAIAHVQMTFISPIIDGITLHMFANVGRGSDIHIGTELSLIHIFAALVQMGYSLFDCVIPTREARHQRLYVFEPGMDTPEGVRRADGRFYRHLYIMDAPYCRDKNPVDKTCDCPLCREHSRAYLQHLFKVNDPQAMRLATAHNLRFYGRLMELLNNAS